jgi:hypothetical protein
VSPKAVASPSGPHAQRASVWLRVAVAALVLGNLVALWVKRGHYVGGWELFGPTFGVLTLNRLPFRDALGAIATSYLNQRARLGYTGAESFVYTLIPGALDHLAPWLLWSQLLSLVLFVGFSWWLTRRLAIRPTLYAACVLSSVALTSYAIVGYPYLPSTAIPYGLAIVWVLSARRPHEGVIRGLLLDSIVFAAVTAIAYDGYEIGKTFFVVPFVAALTVPRIRLFRRATWLAVAAGLAWLGIVTRPMSSNAALTAVPHDLSYLTGLGPLAKRYLIDWYIDFPALGIAAVVALPTLRERRAFWTALLVVSTGVLSLSAFQFDGQFLIPQRFILFGFLAALVTSLALSQDARGVVAGVLGVLVTIGIGYTSWQTVRFVRAHPTSERRNYNVDKVYALPYQHANLDWHVWRDRVHDAEILSGMIRHRPEAHVFFYGFSVLGEDPVNPQVFPSRILLNVGWPRFDRQVRFVDYHDHMWFRFPIRPLSEVEETLRTLEPPFYVHVKEPDYSAADLVATFLNRATVAPVDLGLAMLTSFEVTAYAPPGPVPLPALAERVGAADLAGAPAGFCRTAWTPEQPGESFVVHHWGTMAATLADEIRRARPRAGRLAIAPAIREALDRPTVVHYRGYLANPRQVPLVVTLDLQADDELALLANGRSLVERPRAGPTMHRHMQIAVPPGVTRLDLLYHKFWDKGGVELRTTAADGGALDWRCPIGG